MIIKWQIGDRLQNRWQIYNIIQGGMGMVYVVYDHDFHEVYAAKTFQDEIFSGTSQIADRFRQEALTWINLDAHQNVTQAQFVQTIASKPYLFLEYVASGDLGGWIGTPRLTEDLPQVLRFAVQFCDGMSHALAKGITAHRDIKPQNCLITQDKTLKVTDFGLATVFDDAAPEDMAPLNLQNLSVGLSRTGMAAGTPTHMAPEQFDDAKHVNVQADIYSFGVLLFQMLTGRLPFIGPTWAEIERMHKEQPVPPLKGRHVALSGLVQRCLAKERASRYEDFGEIRQELAGLYEEMTGAAVPEAVVGTSLNATEWTNKGFSLLALGRYEEALGCHNRAIDLDPLLGLAWLNKGVALEKLRRTEKALRCYDRAIDLSSPQTQAVAWRNKGEALYELGRSEEALTCYDRAINLDPGLAVAWLSKAATLGPMGRIEDALRCCDRAIDLDPHLAEAWSNKAAALFELGRTEEALGCCDRAIDLDPREPMAWLNKGSALGRLGWYEEALGCVDRAIDLDPLLAKAWSNKGLLLSNLGRSEGALGCCDKAIDLDSRDGLSWYNKGTVLVNNFRQHEPALPCFEEAQRLGVPQAAQAIALCLRMLGE